MQSDGEWVTDYRRGVENGVWQKLWHYHRNCPGYPTTNFAISKKKPADDELCSRCASLPSSSCCFGKSGDG